MAVVITRSLVRERATPDPDGANRVFYAAQHYAPGTLSVWQNGLRLIATWDDGFTELGSGAFEMRIAPLSGDSLVVQYEPL